MTWGSTTSSFYVTPVILAGSVASGDIYIFTHGVLISNSKSKSASKSSTPRISMSGSSNPRVVVPSYPTPTPGIAMFMYVSIYSMVLEFSSSYTPVSTSHLMVLAVSSLVKIF